MVFFWKSQRTSDNKWQRTSRNLGVRLHKAKHDPWFLDNGLEHVQWALTDRLELAKLSSASIYFELKWRMEPFSHTGSPCFHFKRISVLNLVRWQPPQAWIDPRESSRFHSVVSLLTRVRWLFAINVYFKWVRCRQRGLLVSKWEPRNSIGISLECTLESRRLQKLLHLLFNAADGLSILATGSHFV